MHAVLAWTVGAAYITYKYGYKCKQLPFPKRYVALTGFISIASLVGAMNPAVGGLIAYGTLFGTFLTQYNKPTKCDKPHTTAAETGSDGARLLSSTGNTNPTAGSL